MDLRLQIQKVMLQLIMMVSCKLVDRMEFSFNNFTAIKNWDK